MPEQVETSTEVPKRPNLSQKVKFVGLMIAFLPFALVLLMLDKIIALTKDVVIPRPSGPYAVGRRCCHWVDSSRQEKFSSEEGAKRELLVWFWYPAQEISGSEKAEYIPQAWAQRLKEIKDGIPVRKIFCNAVDDAPVINGDFPLLVFAPGLQALPTGYTALFEELASQGYVVAGVCGPYTPPLVRFPDGKEIFGNEKGQCAFRDENEYFERRLELLPVWIDDLRFVVNKVSELKNSKDGNVLVQSEMISFCQIIDLNKIAALGHSFGGVAALQFSILDERCRAAICMDGWFKPVDNDSERVVQRPFLYFTTCSEREPTEPTPLERAHLGHFSQGWMIKVKGFVHNSFSDGPLCVSPIVQKLANLVAGALSFGKASSACGTIDGGRAVEITRSCVLSFFDQYLRERSTFFQTGVSPFPESVLERLPE